ncbi:undecaprenyl-phosphate glucose phosphotransferase [Halobacteriovorax marinus]|uniref:undecaprenyl-phosphate glucose phosphotransferase n=1 Tax=Halobacteriovorax marinus TaxID=97084 RepID=UPI003A8CCDAB
MRKSSNALSEGINYIAQFLDIAGLSLISIAVHWWYLDGVELSKDYLYSIIFSSLLVFIIFQNVDIYSSWRGRSKFRRVQLITGSWFFCMVILVMVTALLKSTANYSRVWFVTWSALTLVYLNLYRFLLDLILNYSRKKGWNHKNIVIFGAGELGKSVGERINSADWIGFKIKAYFDDDPKKTGQKIYNTEILNSNSLEKFLKENDIKELWIALPFRDEKRVKEILHELRHMSISIKFIPDIFGFRLLNQKISEVAGIPVVQINGTPIQGVNRVIKEVEDKLIAALILVLISPLLIIISIAIKLDSKGPVLFKQIRNGWDGKKIKVYKFRSMSAQDSGLNKLAQATKNDSRVTRVGAFIRRTSLDELPQFLNVLQGRMSIVGPRPHVVSQNEEYKDQVDYYMQRHRVKPGITGWAQVNGFRGETDTLEKMSKRVEYDLYYIENWSLGLDLKIILLTIFKGFMNENAY